MTERLSQVNRMLDRACKRAGVDPVQMRLAMIQALNDKLVVVGGSRRIEKPVEELSA